MDNVKELMERREELSFSLIEADNSEYEEFQQEIQDIENELELLTGKTIEELENEYYGDTQ